ncbi:hypothetical protein WQQ_29700 [Hydrocarboniphaga effusa AP103]|uniref:Uncharacterized protein n=1 Tax=Hydrocarboniphaga effusa AP103 TaxID=1172194 RepID=I8T6M5_9GAMM|nr:hypothetical protein WQQ_29700 [Hydrocarboniphaga effusa AP103]
MHAGRRAQVRGGSGHGRIRRKGARFFFKPTAEPDTGCVNFRPNRPRLGSTFLMNRKKMRRRGPFQRLAQHIESSISRPGVRPRTEAQTFKPRAALAPPLAGSRRGNR